MRTPILALACVFAVAGVARAQFTERAPVRTGGLTHSDYVTGVRVSDDGRFVAYTTPDDAVPEDTNGYNDVYLHDRVTGITELVSKTPAGFAGDSSSFVEGLAGDGSALVFWSWASDLVAGTSYTNLFVFDRTTGTIEVVNVDSNGVYQPISPGGGGTIRAEISADGRFVFFTFPSDTLTPNLPVYTSWGFVRDRLLGTTTLGTVRSTGQASYAQDIGGSDDGRVVVWTTNDPNVLPGSYNFHDDIYVHDTLTGQVRTVNLNNQGVWSNGVSRYPNISGDGQRVAFQSYGSNLWPGDTNGSYDAFVYDLPTSTIQMASVSTAGVVANQPSDWWLQISNDGNRVAFATNADNLVAGDTNGEHDVFLRDLAAQTTERVSVGTGGVQSAFDSSAPDLNADGSIVIFANYGGDLVPSPPATSDWYLNDLTRACPAALAYCSGKTNSAGCVPEVGVAGVPTLSGSVSFFVTARGVINRQPGLFFWGLAPKSTPFAGGTRCVSAPLVRSPVQGSGGSAAGIDCSGSYSYAFDGAVTSAHGLSAGTTVYGQFWGRDPGASPRIGMTDALQFTLCP
jgi:hypothetical protein